MVGTFRETVETLSQQELTTGLEIRDKLSGYSLD
jgi:hypothetical protein